jgi:hypothetical protein
LLGSLVIIFFQTPPEIQMIAKGLKLSFRSLFGQTVYHRGNSPQNQLTANKPLQIIHHNYSTAKNTQQGQFSEGQLIGSSQK